MTNIVLIAVLFVLLNITLIYSSDAVTDLECASDLNTVQNDDTCSGDENVLKCIPYDPNAATVVYRDSNGRLGNWMSVYEFLVAVEIRFGVRPYISSKLKEGLEKYFAGVDIESGTERLCGMEEVVNKFKADIRERQMERILELVESKLGYRPQLERDEQGRWSVPIKLIQDTGLDVRRIVHNNDFHDLGTLTPPAPPGPVPPNYPWGWFSIGRRQADLGEAGPGKAFIMFPEGGYMATQTELEHLASAPGLEERLVKAFKMLPEHTEAAKKTLAKITKQHLDGRGKKKKKKTKSKTKKKKKKKNIDLVYVGIHVRRTDYEHLEKEQGMKRLRPAYYLQAMDMYREFYKDVLFVLIGDDPKWAKDNLGRWAKKSGDLYFAGEGGIDDQNSIGHDLAVMSLCNHTILSHGTFSYWAGFLAGGAVVRPAHFAEYRSSGPLHPMFKKHPLKSPLPRLYIAPK